MGMSNLEIIMEVSC